MLHIKVPSGVLCQCLQVDLLMGITILVKKKYGLQYGAFQKSKPKHLCQSTSQCIPLTDDAILSSRLGDPEDNQL